MLMLDIDLFKKYNDFYGHLQGDQCLYQIAQTIKESLKRPTDLVARWGGEEFTCILPDTDSSGAAIIAERIRKAIMDLGIPHEMSSVKKVVTVSIGVSTALPSADHSFLELLKRTDVSLYRAKELGRNRIFME